MIAALTLSTTLITVMLGATDAVALAPTVVPDVAATAKSQQPVPPTAPELRPRDVRGAPRTPAAAVGSLSVTIPAGAVVRIERGRMVAAWTNSGGPPVDDMQMYVAGAGQRVTRPLRADERAALLRCAAPVRARWTPGSWVRLAGPDCRL